MHGVRSQTPGPLTVRSPEAGRSCQQTGREEAKVCTQGARRWGVGGGERLSGRFETTHSHPVSPGWGGGGGGGRGLRPRGVSARSREQASAGAPQTRAACRPHPGPTPGAGHCPPRWGRQLPRHRAPLKGAPPTPVFLRSHPQPVGSGGSLTSRHFSTSPPLRAREHLKVTPPFGRRIRVPRPRSRAAASRQSPLASPGSGTRCRRPAPADPLPCLCLRRPTARPAPPSPGSPRAAPRGDRSRRWAGRMPPGCSRRTPWLR